MYRYRITVEMISPKPATSPALQFETENHDDIIAIANRMPGRFDLDEDSAKSMAIGMKLFSEIVLRNRTREPFSAIRPAIVDFIGAIKAARPPATSQPGPSSI
jgi:multidrug resistance efflux pump